jgi:RNase P subunit RPR2
MIRYKCKHCGYVLATVEAYRSRSKRVTCTRTTLHTATGPVVQYGTLSPEEVALALGGECPNCKRRITGKTLTVTLKRRGGGEERVVEV